MGNVVSTELNFLEINASFFAKFPMWISLTVSISLGLAMGFIDIDGFDKILSISRMFVFFPFFLLGYYLSQRQEPFTNLLTARNRIIASIVLLVTLIGSYSFLDDTAYTDMLYGTNTYDNGRIFNARFSLWNCFSCIFCLYGFNSNARFCFNKHWTAIPIRVFIARLHFKMVLYN